MTTMHADPNAAVCPGSHRMTTTTTTAAVSGAQRTSGHEPVSSPGSEVDASAATGCILTTGSSHGSDEAPERGANLFVAGLPPSVDDEALEACFAPFGAVRSAKVMLDLKSGHTRGFGFVLFLQSRDAAAARDALQGQPVPDHGGTLQISVSRHRGENLTAESRVVYVRNLPVAVGRPRLETYLQRFGRVVKLQLKGSANGAAAVANAVIEFAQPESARAAVAALHGKRPFEPECEIPLLAKLEEPRKLREQRLQHVAEDADNQFGAAQHPSMSPASNAAAPTRRSKPQLAADAAAHQQQPQLAAKPAESEPRAQEAKAVQKGLRDEVPPTAQPPLPSARPAPTAAGPVYVVPARPSAASEAITSSTAQHLVPSYASPYALGSTAAGGSAPGYYYCFYPPLMGVVPALPGSHSLFGHMYPPTLGYHQPLVPPPQPPQGYYYASAPPAMITHPTMSYTFYAQ